MTRPLARLAGSLALAWGILVAGPKVHAQYDVRVDSVGRFVAPTAQKLWDSNFLALAWKFLTNAVQPSNNVSVALDEANLKLLISATGGTNGGGTVSLGTNLTQLDALNFVSGDMVYHSGSSLDKLATTAAGRALLTAADYAAQRTLLGVVTNTNYQPQSQVLSNLDILLNGNASNYFRGDGTFAQISSNHIAGLVQALSDLNGLISGKQSTSLVLNSLVGLSLTNGDLLTVSNGQLVRLAIPAQNGKTLLSTNGLFVFWGDPPSSSGAGTVTSVDLSNRLSGLTVSGGPISASGTFILDGILGLASGGSGASNAAQARTNFGLVIGVNVQAYNANLATLAALTGGNATNFFAGDGSYKQVTTNMIPGLVAAIAALEPLNANKYQATNSTLTLLAALTGGNATNFFAGDGSFKQVTSNMIPGLVAALAALEPLNANKYQASNSMLTAAATGGTSTNFFAGDGVYKQVTTNMVPGLVAVLAALEPLNSNKYQSSNTVLTTLATLNGANLTNLNGSSIASGTVADARIDTAIARLSGPTFTSDPKAPTPSAGDNDTSIATTAFVLAEIARSTNYAVATVTNLIVTGSFTIPHLAYSSAWNGATNGVDRDAIYDQLHIGDTNDDGLADKLDLSAAGYVRTTSGGVISTGSSSANLAADISDETGSGALVFGTGPTVTNGIALGYTEQDVATYSGTNVVADFTTEWARWTATNNLYLLSSTNRPGSANRVRKLFIEITGDTVDRTIAFNGSWRRFGSNITTIPSNKIVGISLKVYGTNESGISIGIAKEE